MRRIVFIEPKAPNLHIFSKFALPRLGSFVLGTMMKEKGWDVEVMIEEIRPIDYDRIRQADLVGISSITPTARRAYAVADKIRKMDITVIMGGPHVTALPDEALDHADYVVRGEGEDALMAFADAWTSGRDFSKVPNLSFREDGKNVHHPIRPLTRSLDELPYPDFSLLSGKRRSIAGRSTIPVQTSRGCPFDCSFCSVTGMFGRRVRFRSTRNIIEELRRYDSRRNVIFFYDDNFTANRNRAKELLTAMIRERFRFQWSTQVRADIARDSELVGLMKEAGCHTLYIGFESVNPDSLRAMKKEQTVEEIAEAVRVLHRAKIHIHGMFVYGFDEDDWKTVKETVKFARRAKLMSTQFLILTPFPGSEFYNRIENQKRFAFRDWNLYDAHHVVFQPTRFSLYDLQRAQIFSHKKFYSLRDSWKKFFRGKWIDIGLAAYARNLNRVWQKNNKTFLRVVELLRPRKGVKISVQYREDICL